MLTALALVVATAQAAPAIHVGTVTSLTAHTWGRGLVPTAGVTGSWDATPWMSVTAAVQGRGDEGGLNHDNAVVFRTPGKVSATAGVGLSQSTYQRSWSVSGPLGILEYEGTTTELAVGATGSLGGRVDFGPVKLDLFGSTGGYEDGTANARVNLALSYRVTRRNG